MQTIYVFTREVLCFDLPGAWHFLCKVTAKNASILFGQLI